mmetsp:Transcript_28943/g.40689  ORF Transcript_28943/g.40689 Transcript_28943/m.40689 type:complete len:140 (+) Transcript_28943:137-556(+)
MKAIIDKARQLLKLGERPPTHASWPRNLVTLLDLCWEQSPQKRPSMAEVVQMLEELLLEEQRWKYPFKYWYHPWENDGKSARNHEPVASVAQIHHPSSTRSRASSCASPLDSESMELKCTGSFSKQPSLDTQHQNAEDS